MELHCKKGHLLLYKGVKNRKPVWKCKECHNA